MTEAPDIEVTTVHDHKFEPIDGVWWKLCRHCKLGRASHALGCDPQYDPPYQPPHENRPTGEDDDHDKDDDLPIITNEDTMHDAQMNIDPKDAPND